MVTHSPQRVDKIVRKAAREGATRKQTAKRIVQSAKATSDRRVRKQQRRAKSRAPPTRQRSGATAQIVYPPTRGRANARGDSTPVLPTDALTGGTPNDYLCSLLDPHGTVPISYPDDFMGDTACFKGIINLPLPYATQLVGGDGNNGWAPGSFHFNVNAEFNAPLRYIGVFQSTATSAEATIDRQSTETGLIPVGPFDGRVAIAQRKSDVTELSMENGIWYNILGVYETELATYSPMFRGQCTSDNTTFFGRPHIGSGSAIQNATIAVGITGGATSIELRSISSGGIGTAIAQATPAAGTTYSMVIPVANQRTNSAPPGVGYQIRALGNTSPLVLTSISLRMVTALTNVRCEWAEVELPTADLADGLYDEYRVVSMCHLLSYRGATLNNAGSCAATLYGGGHDPGNAGLWNYQNLTEVVNAQDNAVTLGSYGIWYPTDEVAMAFRPIDEGGCYNFPYLACSGTYVGDGVSAPLGGCLRLRVSINYECITPCQLLPVFPSRTDLSDERRRAQIFLRGFKPVMENPLHLGMIKKVLGDAFKSAAGGIRKAKDFYDANKQWINPAVQAGGMALMAL